MAEFRSKEFTVLWNIIRGVRGTKTSTLASVGPALEVPPSSGHHRGLATLSRLNYSRPSSASFPPHLQVSFAKDSAGTLIHTDLKSTGCLAGSVG